MKKRVLRKWVKNVGLIILGILLCLLFQSFEKETNGTTPNGGEYTCKGTIIKVCSGDSRASKYFE